jgi:hypothetical protein
MDHCILYVISYVLTVILAQELQTAIRRDEESTDPNGVRWIAVGHSGHGINSWAMHYYIAYKPLYIMWGMSFGGARGKPFAVVFS